MAVAISANAVGSAGSGTSKTFTSFDCAGATALVVFAYHGNQAGIAVDYNGDALTQQSTITESGQTLSSWLLFSPDSGSNTVTVSWTNSTEYAIFVVALTG